MTTRINQSALDRQLAEAKAKRGRKRTEDGFVVQNFRDLLTTLSTLSLCTCQTTGSKLPPFKRFSRPSPYHERAFHLLQLTPP